MSRLFEELWILLFKNYGNQNVEEKIIDMQKLLILKRDSPEIIEYYSMINNVVTSQIIWCILSQKPLTSLIHVLEEIMTTNSRKGELRSSIEGIDNINEWDGFSILIKFIEVSPDFEKKQNAIHILSVLLSSGSSFSLLSQLEAGLRVMGANPQNMKRLRLLQSSTRNTDLAKEIELLNNTIGNYQRKGENLVG